MLIIVLKRNGGICSTRLCICFCTTIVRTCKMSVVINIITIILLAIVRIVWVVCLIVCAFFAELVLLLKKKRLEL